MLQLLLYVLGCLAALSFTLFSALGVFMVVHLVRTQRSPVDTSNRINKIRLVWFALTREELFVGTFPWLKRDELENITVVEKAKTKHK